MPKGGAPPLRDLAGPAFCGLVLLSTTLAALVVSIRHAPALPLLDEWAHVAALTDRGRVPLDWVLVQHNENRMPLPKLIWLAETRLSSWDSRIGAAVNVLILAAAALAVLLALNRVRGRLSWTDAAVPLLFLHWGHWDNLTWPFQIVFDLHYLLVCLLISFLVRLGRTPARELAIPFGLCLVAMPLCSPATFPYLGLLAPWWCRILWRERAGSNFWRLFALPAAALILAGLVLGTYQKPPVHPSSPGLQATLGVSLQCLSACLGSPGIPVGTVSGVMSVAALLACAALLVLGWRRSSTSTSPQAGLLLVLIATAALVYIIGESRAGYGRDASFRWRYVLLATPLPLLLYLGADSVDRASMLRAAMAVAMGVVYVANLFGSQPAREARTLANEAALRDVGAGLPIPLIAQRNLSPWFPDPWKISDFEIGLEQLSAARYSAWRNSRPPARPASDEALRSGPVLTTLRDGRSLIELLPGEGAEIAVEAGPHSLELSFGHDRRSVGSVRFQALLLREGAAPEPLWSEFQEGSLEVGRARLNVDAPRGSRLRLEAVPAARNPTEPRLWMLIDRDRR
ncbi:MAG TPA: hypothetical protein VE981_10110 [Planctomycetota bacterium]|nr:hypothetical protein [Planctomycetota bacterium]